MEKKSYFISESKIAILLLLSVSPACQSELPKTGVVQVIAPLSPLQPDRTNNPPDLEEIPEPVLPSAPSPRFWATDALVYKGVATASGDAEALVEILERGGFSYRVVTSSELDSLSAEELRTFGTFVWPGGYAGQMSSSLTRATRDRIAGAVKNDGVSFVGFCAGAFIAVSPSTSWGLSLVESPTLPYYHLEDEGVGYAMVTVSDWFQPGSSRSLLWWGGPKLTGFKPSHILAKYADTLEPAITLNYLESGAKVLLSGPHPEAPDSWRTYLGLRDTDGSDQDIALDMIERALER